jgi:hypothetical protein
VPRTTQQLLGLFHPREAFIQLRTQLVNLFGVLQLGMQRLHGSHSDAGGAKNEALTPTCLTTEHLDVAREENFEHLSTDFGTIVVRMKRDRGLPALQLPRGDAGEERACQEFRPQCVQSRP